MRHPFGSICMLYMIGGLIIAASAGAPRLIAAEPGTEEIRTDLAFLKNALDDVQKCRAKLSEIDARAAEPVKKHRERRLAEIKAALLKLAETKKHLPEREHTSLLEIEVVLRRESDWLREATPEELAKDQSAWAESRRAEVRKHAEDARQRYLTQLRRLGLEAVK